MLAHVQQLGHGEACQEAAVAVDVSIRFDEGPTPPPGLIFGDVFLVGGDEDDAARWGESAQVVKKLVAVLWVREDVEHGDAEDDGEAAGTGRWVVEFSV